MSKYVSAEIFANKSTAIFGSLPHHGFVGPSVEDYRLLYTSADLMVKVLYDDRDGRVITMIEDFVDGLHVRAGLRCLYVEAGLGPAQDIRDIARTTRSLGTALSSQMAALEKLIPLLRSPSADKVLVRCHGR